MEIYSAILSGGENGPVKESWKGTVYGSLIIMLKMISSFCLTSLLFIPLPQKPPYTLFKILLKFLVKINVKFLVSLIGDRYKQRVKKRMSGDMGRRQKIWILFKM